MQVKTEGIVLHSLRYSDSSLIVKIFTREHGLLAFMVKGTRSKKSATKAVLFQTLNLLDLDTVIHENRNFQSIREVKLGLNPAGIQGNVHKISVTIFIGELLQKLIKEGYANEPLFDLLKLHIIRLNEDSFDPNFHLKLLLAISQELGFYPIDNYNDNEPLFSIEEGKFVQSGSGNMDGAILTHECSLSLHQLIDGGEIKFNRDQRRALLNELIKYFQFHNPGMSSIKSSSVLHEIF